MSSNKITTRKQLQGYGATSHQARSITKNLSPIHIESRTYAYPISDVIASIREYLKRPRLKTVTHQKLRAVLEALLQRLGNVIDVPFGQPINSEISKSTKRLIQAVADTDQALAELKATAATAKGKHKI